MPAVVPDVATVLALDTSTDRLCCAVARMPAAAAPELLASGDRPCRRRSNVELLTAADETLAAAGLAWADLSAVLVGRGPGSFTGVRIGIATAKGLACGLGVPLYGVSALDAAAWHAWASGVRGTLAVAGDAMRGEVYPGIYLLTDAGAARTFAAETVLRASACAELWATRPDAAELTLSGDGLARWQARFEEAGLARFAPQDAWHPSGEGLLRAFAVARAAGVAGTGHDRPSAGVADAAPGHAEEGALSGLRQGVPTPVPPSSMGDGHGVSSAASAWPGVTPSPGAGEAALVLPIYTRLSDAEENERRRLGLAEPASVRRTGVDEALAGIHAQLRPAATRDARALAGLEAAAFADTSHTPWSAAQFADDLATAGHSWWMAHDQGELVAFAGGRLAGAECEVLDVAVAEGRRREGLARRLLARVCYDLQQLGAEAATLEVDEANMPARALYASLGFAQVGRRAGYYGAGRDALVLRAVLPLAGDARHAGDVPTAGSLPPVDVAGWQATGLLASQAGTAHARAAAPEETAAGATGGGSSRPPFPADGRSGAGGVDAAGRGGTMGSPAVPAAGRGPSRPGDAARWRPRDRAVGDGHAAPRTSARRAALVAAAPLVLAIESSCDETAIAVIDGGGAILSNVVATQIDFHARFGGVVPEIASRKHTEAIVGVYEEAMARAAATLGLDAPLEPADLAAIGVTAGPGLVGALVVGVAFAKGLAVGAGLPLVPVHHLEGHLLANLFATPDLAPPFVASLVSGGNTMLVHVRGWGDYHVLGTTIDDAVGEAFDKVAKALGLGYPGGPVISRLAARGNPRAIAFPRAMLHSGDYRFSLSGLKTAVITHIEGEERAGRAIDLADLAASFTAAVVDVQVAKAVAAVEETGVTDFCLGGGVAANPQLRAAYEEAFGRMGVRVTEAPHVVCGDNGAMIAVAALRNLRAGVVAPPTLDADPNAPLGEWSSALPPRVDARAWPPRPEA